MSATDQVVPAEPPVGTWVEDRHGGLTMRHRNGGWAPPGCEPLGQWAAMWGARGPLIVTGPWGSTDQTPAADSERDERRPRVQHAHFDGDGNDLGPCVLVSDLNGGPTEQWSSHVDAETEHTRVLTKGGPQDTGWLHAACSCGEYAWPCPHWLLAEHDRLTALIAEQAATIREQVAQVIEAERDAQATLRPISDAMYYGYTKAAAAARTAALGSQRTEGQ